MNMIEQFGPYQLTERIATGGMAEIFKAIAHGSGGFQKVLAIKRLHSRYTQHPEFVEMLKDEAKVAVDLSHNNIVKIFDLGRVQEHYFIAMEYYHGRDLNQLMRLLRTNQQQLPLEAALYVIEQVCAGLDYAHRKRDAQGHLLKLIHRDISPQNIVLTFEGDVKIVDFGIAKSTASSLETDAGVIKGKFCYMSPEQASGKRLDHRTDVFSAGILLYELLTGQPLYDHPDDIVLLDNVRQANFVPLLELRPDLHPKIERVLLKALSRRRDERYPSARHFQHSLQKLIQRFNLHFDRIQLEQLMKQSFPDEYGPQASEQYLSGISDFDGEELSIISDYEAKRPAESDWNIPELPDDLIELDLEDLEGVEESSVTAPSQLQAQLELGEDPDVVTHPEITVSPSLQVAHPSAPQAAHPSALQVAHPLSSQNGESVNAQNNPQIQANPPVQGFHQTQGYVPGYSAPSYQADQLNPNELYSGGAQYPQDPAQSQPNYMQTNQGFIAQPEAINGNAPYGHQPLAPQAEQRFPPAAPPIQNSIAPFTSSNNPQFEEGHASTMILESERQVNTDPVEYSKPAGMQTLGSAMRTLGGGVSGATKNAQRSVSAFESILQRSWTRFLRAHRNPQERLFIWVGGLILIFGILNVIKFKRKSTIRPTISISSQTNRLPQVNPQSLPIPSTKSQGPVVLGESSFNQPSNQPTPKIRPMVSTVRPRKPVNQTIEIRLDTKPRGATISYNDDYLDEETPTTIQVQEGVDAELLFELDGYEEYAVQINPIDGKLYKYELTRKKGTIVIESTPSNASVYDSDGQELGTTPLKLLNQEIKDSAYRFEIRHSGYEVKALKRNWPSNESELIITTTLEPLPTPKVDPPPKKKRVKRRKPRPRVQPRARSQVRPRPAPVGEGSLFIRSIPFGSLYIDGNFIKRNVPYASVDKLSAGSHRVKVCYKDNASDCEERRVRIRANKTVKEKFIRR